MHEASVTGAFPAGAERVRQVPLSFGPTPVRCGAANDDEHADIDNDIEAGPRGQRQLPRIPSQPQPLRGQLGPAVDGVDADADADADGSDPVVLARKLHALAAQVTAVQQQLEVQNRQLAQVLRILIPADPTDAMSDPDDEEEFDGMDLGRPTDELI